jgi:hypothetical protein
MEYSVKRIMAAKPGHVLAEKFSLRQLLHLLPAHQTGKAIFKRFKLGTTQAATVNLSKKASFIYKISL